MDQATFNLLAELAIGLGAGLLGGLLGIGGSVIMIPALAILLGSRDPNTQHLYQAAAMAVNLAVSVPAAIRHHREGALVPRLLLYIAPVALVCIIGGVLLSNQIDGRSLRLLFAGFLCYVAIVTIIKMYRRTPDHELSEAKITPARAGSVGAVLGGAAGLLGIGGGILAIPLAQGLCKVPLKNAIAVSSATMSITAGVGATLKIATVGQWGFEPRDAILLSLTMAPTAVIGGWFGAKLTHRLPLGIVRVVLIALMLVSAWRMAAPPSRAGHTTPASAAPASE